MRLPLTASTAPRPLHDRCAPLVISPTPNSSCAWRANDRWERASTAVTAPRSKRPNVKMAVHHSVLSSCMTKEVPQSECGQHPTSLRSNVGSRVLSSARSDKQKYRTMRSVGLYREQAKSTSILRYRRSEPRRRATDAQLYNPRPSFQSSRSGRERVSWRRWQPCSQSFHWTPTDMYSGNSRRSTKSASPRISAAVHASSAARTAAAVCGSIGGVEEAGDDANAT